MTYKFDNLFRRELAGIILLLLCVMAFYGRFIFAAHGQSDLLEEGYPYAFFISQKLASGELPLWCNFTFSGFPLIGVPNNAIFDWLNLIYIIFPFNVAFLVMPLINVLQAALGMYLFSRLTSRSISAAFVSAVIFSLGPLYIYCINGGYLYNLKAFEYIPLIFLFYELTLSKRKLYLAALGGLTIGIQVLSSHPQFSFYSLFYILFRFIWEAYPYVKRFDFKGLKNLSILTGWMILIGLLISSVKILPVLEFRDVGLTAASAWREVTTFEEVVRDFLFKTRGSLSPLRLPEVLLPHYQIFYLCRLWRNSTLHDRYDI